MTKFIVLYHASADAVAAMSSMSQEEMAKGMEGWMAWSAKLGDKLVDLGAPLGNGQALSPAGSSASTKEVSGFSIIQASDLDEAKSLLEGHPHFGYGEGCSIEVHEAMPIPGM